jgi:hypothetical protein
MLSFFFLLCQLAPNLSLDSGTRGSFESRMEKKSMNIVQGPQDTDAAKIHVLSDSDHFYWL